MKDNAELFGILEQLVKDGTESRGEAMVLMYDKEDGFFVSTIETGCHHYPVKDIKTGTRRATLGEAIEAAAAWQNEERLKPFHGYIKPIMVVLALAVASCSHLDTQGNSTSPIDRALLSAEHVVNHEPA